MKPVLSIHPYHDSNIAVLSAGSYFVLELERFFGERHIDWMSPTAVDLNPEKISCLIAAYLERCFPGGFGRGIITHATHPPLEPFKIADWRIEAHHRSHAAAAFYQSPFRKAVVVSYDGGGPDGYFRVFQADYECGVRYLGDGLKLNLGSAYAVLAEPIKEINRTTKSLFPNAGKMMGLAAYGSVVTRWLPAIHCFYRNVRNSGERLKLLPALGQEIGLDLGGKNLSGPAAADYAATCQQGFEDVLFEALLPVAQAQQIPLCLSGGCALNVSFNEKLARRLRIPVFVPPNPNDCGLAVGALLLYQPPRERVDLTYAGLPLLDLERLDQHAPKFRITPVEVARLLADGKIIGVARGRSEHGPRALGNRSILADPAVSGLKGRLNQKIKYREDFRPTAR